MKYYAVIEDQGGVTPLGCGCKLAGLNGEQATFKLCSMHNAAPDLLSAAKKMKSAVELGNEGGILKAADELQIAIKGAEETRP